jgi:hypothetical protein
MLLSPGQVGETWEKKKVLFWLSAAVDRVLAQAWSDMPCESHFVATVCPSRPLLQHFEALYRWSPWAVLEFQARGQLSGHADDVMSSSTGQTDRQTTCMVCQQVQCTGCQHWCAIGRVIPDVSKHRCSFVVLSRTAWSEGNMILRKLKQCCPKDTLLRHRTLEFLATLIASVEVWWYL